MTEQVKVTQADREAAADQVEWLRAATLQLENIEPFFMPDFAQAARDGIWDNHPFVQSFARHRIAAQAELLEALEGLWMWCRNWDCEFMDDDEFPEYRARIEASIAKAKGEA